MFILTGCIFVRVRPCKHSGQVILCPSSPHRAQRNVALFTLTRPQFRAYKGSSQQGWGKIFTWSFLNMHSIRLILVCFFAVAFASGKLLPIISSHLCVSFRFRPHEWYRFFIIFSRKINTVYDSRWTSSLTCNSTG